MIIDQLPTLASVQETDEIPVERGTTTYKTTLQKVKALIASLLTKADIGLGNVDNVQQYSANNPPPYPVTSVNGKTGDVVETDYILEQGTSGIWTYRKWNSGVYECWGTYAETSSTAFAAVGNVFYRIISGISLPITFAEKPTVTTSIEMGNVGSSSVTAYTSSVSIVVLSSSAQARSVTANIRVSGKWK